MRSKVLTISQYHFLPQYPLREQNNKIVNSTNKIIESDPFPPPPLPAVRNQFARIAPATLCVRNLRFFSQRTFPETRDTRFFSQRFHRFFSAIAAFPSSPSARFSCVHCRTSARTPLKELSRNFILFYSTFKTLPRPFSNYPTPRPVNFFLSHTFPLINLVFPLLMPPPLMAAVAFLSTPVCFNSTNIASGNLIPELIFPTLVVISPLVTH